MDINLYYNYIVKLKNTQATTTQMIFEIYKKYIDC